MLIKEIRPGETLRIGDAVITLVKKSGQAARLCINADPSIKIELVERRGEPVSDGAR